MDITDELRAYLDERGIYWLACDEEKQLETNWDESGYEYTFTEHLNRRKGYHPNTLSIYTICLDVTMEQIVEVTRKCLWGYL